MAQALQVRRQRFFNRRDCSFVLFTLRRVRSASIGKLCLQLQDVGIKVMLNLRETCLEVAQQAFLQRSLCLLKGSGGCIGRLSHLRQPVRDRIVESLY